MRFTFFFLFTCLSIQTLISQDSLITIKGDTISGKIKLLNSNNKVPYALIDNEEGKSRIPILGIKEIEHSEHGIIEPIKVGSQYKLAQRISDGYLSLFKFSSSDNVDKFDTELLQKETGENLIVPGYFGFRNRMTEFLIDCINISSKIDSKELGKDDLTQIIDDYNGCIASRTQKKSIAEPSDSQQTDTILALLNDFETLLKYSNKIDNKENVNKILLEIRTNLSQTNSIPTYLINTLKTAVSQDENLLSIVEKLEKQTP